MRFVLIFLLCAEGAMADVVVATRTIRPTTIITANDVAIVRGDRPDAFDRVENVVGQEARVALYQGRPILVTSIGPPALIDRNQIVSVRFKNGGLTITTDGRALERGGLGDRVRVMNTASRATVFGYVQADGSVVVKP